MPPPIAMSRNITSQGDSRRFENAALPAAVPLDQITLHHPALVEDQQFFLRMARWWKMCKQASKLVCVLLLAWWAASVFGTSADPSQSPGVEVSGLPTCKEVLTTPTTTHDLVNLETFLHAEVATWWAQQDSHSQQSKTPPMMLPWLDSCDLHNSMSYYDASDVASGITLQRCSEESVRLFEEVNRYEAVSNILVRVLATVSHIAELYRNASEEMSDTANTIKQTPNLVLDLLYADKKRYLEATLDRVSAALVETQQRIDALGLGSSIDSKRSSLAQWKSTCVPFRLGSMDSAQASQNEESL